MLRAGCIPAGKEDHGWPAARVRVGKTSPRRSSSRRHPVSDQLGRFRQTKRQPLLALCNLEQGWERALRHLERAERLLERPGDAKQLGVVRAEQAKALAGLGLSETALARATEATTLLAAEPRGVQKPDRVRREALLRQR